MKGVVLLGLNFPLFTYSKITTKNEIELCLPRHHKSTINPSQCQDRFYEMHHSEYCNYYRIVEHKKQLSAKYVQNFWSDMKWPPHWILYVLMIVIVVFLIMAILYMNTKCLC